MMPNKYQFGHELRHLVYFQELARQLHFRRAAESLGVAQPALSRQIVQLETALGAPLFTRTKRRVELTPAGAALLERVTPLLQNLQQLPAWLQAVAAGAAGRVSVAYTGLAMATVLPDILRRFSEEHPKIRVELNESPTVAQVQALLAGETDCGFFHPDGQLSRELKTRVILSERNGVLLPASHPLSRQRNLRLRNLADTPFVLFPRAFNPGFYDRLIAAFAQAGIAPHIAEEVWPRINGLGLVRAGLGATFITPSEAQHLPRGVVFRALQGPAPESRLVLGWRHNPDMREAVRTFIAEASRTEHPN